MVGIWDNRLIYRQILSSTLTCIEPHSIHRVQCSTYPDDTYPAAASAPPRPHSSPRQMGISTHFDGSWHFPKNLSKRNESNAMKWNESIVWIKRRLTTASIVRHHLLNCFPIARQTFREQIRIDWIRQIGRYVGRCFAMLSLIFTNPPATKLKIENNLMHLQSMCAGIAATSIALTFANSSISPLAHRRTISNWRWAPPLCPITLPFRLVR